MCSSDLQGSDPAAKELGYSQQHQGQRDRSNRIDVPQGVQADPPLLERRHVAKMLGDVAMRRLMQRDRKDDRQRVNRDELDEIEFQMGGGETGDRGYFSRLPRRVPMLLTK